MLIPQRPHSVHPTINRPTAAARWLSLLTVAAIFSLAALPGYGQSAPLSDSAQQQIASVIALKNSFSAGEQKLSSNLALASRQALGKPLGVAASLVNPLTADAQGLVAVTIRGSVTAALLSDIVARGGSVDGVAPSNDRLEATIPLTRLEALAARADVGSIRTPAQVRNNVGSLTPQAYSSHRAKEVVAGGISGAGVKIGVLSDSASAARVAALIASGDLGPGTTVLPGQAGPAGATDEGTAMMEIVQDLTPSSQVYFASAFNGESQFAANIVALGVAGCSVVVDDVSYSDESPFQDSTVAQGVNTFVAAGGIYFSSAANSGNKTNNNSTTWEGDFVSGGNVGGPIAAAGETGTVNDFGGGQTYDGLLQSTDVVDLFWADPLGASTNDYDLFILNSTGTTLKGFSASSQNGTQDPFEEVTTPANGGNYSSPAAGDRIVIVKFSGAARALHLDSFGEAALQIATTGATRGHNAGRNTQSCAATYWNSARTGTKPFNGTNNPTEPFSLDGPRKIFFNPNGTAITPGNFLFSTSGGLTLQKPDFTAADGVTTRTPGFNPFYGTSAAAPHAAAIAGLVKSAKPALTNAQISTILHNTALDNMAPGPDRDGGVGVVMAAQAVQAALATPVILLTPTPVTVPPIQIGGSD